jgi:hypothetical protein
VDQRCIRVERLLRVGHRRERLVLHVDQGDRLLGQLRGHRRDCGDDVCLESHLLFGEQPPVLDQLAVEHVRHVRMGQDGKDARERPRPRRVDRDDPRPRVVGVAKPRVQLPGHRQVGGVAANPGDLLLAVRPNERPLLGRAHAVSSR